MKKILFLHRLPSYQSSEIITHELRRECFAVKPVEIESFDSHAVAPADFDLAIIHLPADNPASRETYLGVRDRFPELPILVFIRDQAISTLKSGIRDAFSQTQHSV